MLCRRNIISVPLMKKKHRGIRMFEGVEVGRSILEYRARIQQAVAKRVDKIANNHFAKLTTLLLATAFLSAHGIYA